MSETKQKSKTETEKIDLEKNKKLAYLKGLKKGLDAGREQINVIDLDEFMEDPNKILDDIHEGLSVGYFSSAEYCNHVLPELRQLAGYKDHGMGTYRDGGTDEDLNMNEITRKFNDGLFIGIKQLIWLKIDRDIDLNFSISY